MAVALGVISVVLAGVSAVQQRKAAKTQRKQNEVSNRIAANQRVRAVRQSIAAGRVRRGQIQAAGFAGGVSGSSAVAGATGALATDVATAQGASNQQFTGQLALTSLSNTISSQQSRAASFAAGSQIAGGLAQPQTFEALQNFNPFTTG